MAINNANIYNAAVAGATAGIASRWLSNTSSTSYNSQALLIQAFATAFDAAIAPMTGGGSKGQADVVQAICAAFWADRVIPPSVNIQAAVLPLVALYTSVATKLQPDGSGGSAVTSVFGRTGDVIAQFGDYSSSLISNVSSVAGTSVTDALDLLANNNPVSNVYNVGSYRGFYSTIQDALTARAASTPANQYGVIQIWPGVYNTSAVMDVPANTVVCAQAKGTVQLHNDTTETFNCAGGGVSFIDLDFVGSTTSGLYCIIGNDQANLHLINLDVYNQSGNNTQGLIVQSGANWHLLNVQNCTIDYRAAANYAVALINTATAARFVDCWFEECFIDCFSLTNFGGAVFCQNVQDTRFWYNVFRGTDAGAPKFYTGMFLSKGGGSTTGTPQVEFAHHTGCGVQSGPGGVASFNEAGTVVTMENCLARGAITAGTLTTHNTNVA